jgi:hypothetical protein
VRPIRGLAPAPWFSRNPSAFARRKKENAFLHQRVAKLEAEVKARAPRMDLSGAVRLERASKVYRKLAAKYHPDHNPATADVMKDLNEFWQVLKGA